MVSCWPRTTPLELVGGISSKILFLFQKKKKKSVKVKECVLNFFLQVCPNRKTNNMVAKSREMAILPIKGPGFLGVVIVDLGTFYTLENLLLVSFPIKQ